MISWEVIQGDALEVMAGLPVVDACITDPPYNAINRQTNGLRLLDKGAADSMPVNIAAVAAHFDRLVSGSCYVFCSGEQFTEWTAEFKNRGQSVRNAAWVKTNPSPMNGEHLWLSAMELCVFAKKAGATFNRFCAAPVWTGPIVTNQIHETEKPVWLMRELILASTNPGDTVLDPFCGSGTTGVACAIEGRNFIGIEQDAHYCDVARARITRACGQYAEIPKRPAPETHLPLFAEAAA